MKNIIYTDSITEAGKYLAEISGYDKEILSLVLLIAEDQTDKIKENTTISPQQNYTTRIIQLSDKLKELEINNIDNLVTRKRFLQDEDLISTPSEPNGKLLFQIFYLS